MAPDQLERLKAALERYVEPLLGLTLADAGAIVSVAQGPDRPLARIALGFPVGGGYSETLARSLDDHLAAEGIESRPAYEIEARRRAFRLSSPTRARGRCPKSPTSLRSRRARAASASRRSQQTSRLRSRRRERAWASSMPTSTGQACRA
jgi:hypothetical protein